MSRIVIGIDPGARYVGVSVINLDTNKILLSSTYVRDDDTPPVTWAAHATKQVLNDVIAKYPNALVGIENVVPPQAYYKGKLALMNPKNAIHLALVVGALANALPDAVIIRPGKHGSQAEYPAELKGVRPKTLPGVNQKAGTRNHERSAYDLALLVEETHKEGYKLDKQQGLFS